MPADNILKTVISVILLLSVPVLKSSGMEQETENAWKLRKGAFIKVIPREELSTLTADTEDEVTFINIQDMYVYETNAVPSGTIFYGEIEDVKEPAEGRNGALKILFSRMITPDKKAYRIKAHLYSENDNYIGGNPTKSIYYHKVPHYVQGLKPMLQVAPLNVYEQGSHTVIKPGQEFFIIIEDDIVLK